MSVKISFFLRPTKDDFREGPAYEPLHPPIEMTRVPAVAEIVSLGNDQYGVAADYVVDLVHHCPDKPNGIDAELYVHRVDITKEKLRAAGRPSGQPSPEWPADARPSFFRA